MQTVEQDHRRFNSAPLFPLLLVRVVSERFRFHCKRQNCVSHDVTTFADLRPQQQSRVDVLDGRTHDEASTCWSGSLDRARMNGRSDICVGHVVRSMISCRVLAVSIVTAADN